MANLPRHPSVTNLQVVSAAPGEVVLSWDAIDVSYYTTNSRSQLRYSIQRKLAGAAWPTSGGVELYNRIGSTTGTTFTDTTAAAGVSYEYRVYWSYGAWSEPVGIIAKGTDPVLGDYFDIVRDEDGSTNYSPHRHVVGQVIDLDLATIWNRPMGAFNGTWNGKGVPDIGIANGFKDRTLDWADPSLNGGIPRWDYFRGAYWGHADYEAEFGAQWPPDTLYQYAEGFDPAQYDSYGSSSSVSLGKVVTDTFDGNEFWIQFRMKVDSARFEGNSILDASAGKLLYLQTCEGSSACQWFFSIKPATQGRQLVFAHDGQPEVGGNGNNLQMMDEGGIPFEIRPDEWWTYMIHMKPGHANTEEKLSQDGTVEVFAAGPGETTWRTLYSNTAFGFNFTFWPVDGSSKTGLPFGSRPTPDFGPQGTTNPPAYNSFSPRHYPNHYQSDSGEGAQRKTNAIYWTQIILSSQPIPCPQV